MATYICGQEDVGLKGVGCLLESNASYDEIKKAVWDCGINKSSGGPDGFTFEFFQRYWDLINQDVLDAVLLFFSSGSFPPGCNYSFIALIPKTQDALMVKDFRPISLIGSMIKIIAKILANRLSLVISDLVSDVQSAFASNRQILDGPFILNELLSWCKHKNTKAMIFKLAYFFENVLNASLYKGIQIDDSLSFTHLFYDYDVVFIGKWDTSNFSTIFNVLKCFFLASGLKINLHKSKLMCIGIPHDVVASTTSSIGCPTLSTPFNYLGVKVDGIMSRLSSWDDVIAKLSFTLPSGKAKPSPLMGSQKMESARRNFFNGVDDSARKMYLFGWKRILASKKNGGLDVSSFFALYRALLFKWIWRFIYNGSSLWSRFIKANYGARGAIDNAHTFPRKRGNGDATSFWDDVWLANSSLKKLFPMLYSLELDKQCSVAVKVKDSSFISSFRRISRGGIEEEQLRLHVDGTSYVALSQSSDRWVWRLDSSVKSAYRFIDDSFLPKVGIAKAPETDGKNQNPNRLGWVRDRVGGFGCRFGY
nr:hypothetical protein [Tanacetum cinerariifolium]